MPSSKTGDWSEGVIRKEWPDPNSDILNMGTPGGLVGSLLKASPSGMAPC